MPTRTSLQQRYPGRYEVPCLIALSLGLLLLGLSLPIVTVQKKILLKVVTTTYSVALGVRDLAIQGDDVLAAVVFFFSMVFPFVKLAALGTLWFIRLAEHQRHWILHWLGLLGKWSMLDVFAVAIMVVLAKLRTLTTVTPRVGVYCFGSAILLSMLTTMYVERLARRASKHHPRPL